MGRFRSDTTILALDLATHFGWAHGPADGTPVFGAYKLPTDPNGLGVTAEAFHMWLVQMVKDANPGLIVFEAPINGMGATNMRAQMILKGLIWHAEFYAQMKKIAVVQVDNGKWKKHLTGNGRVNKKMKPYPVIVQLEKMGFGLIKNDNAADAVGIWLHTAAHINPKSAVNTTPLFAGVA